MATNRIIRAQGRAATTTPEPTALRRARRTDVSEVHGQRSTTSATRQGKATVAETHRDEQLEAVRFGPGEEPAFVRVAHGKTIGLPNFSGIRIDVSVTLPCLPEHVRGTMAAASELVIEGLAAEEDYMVGALAPAHRTANRRG